MPEGINVKSSEIRKRCKLSDRYLTRVSAFSAFPSCAQLQLERDDRNGGMIWTCWGGDGGAYDGSLGGEDKGRGEAMRCGFRARARC
jgi:hypothetical protein